MTLADLTIGGLFTDGDWVESKDQDPNGDVRLLQLADVGDGIYVNKSSRYLTSAKAKTLRCTFLKPNDILLARMPDPIGRACIFPGDDKLCITVVDVCIVRPNPQRVETRWLLHSINSPHFRNSITEFVSGTTRQRISRSNLSKLLLKVPPLAEQKHIAALLDEADTLRRKRRESLAKLDTLLQSIFLEMFGDPVTNPKGWEVTTIGDVCSEIYRYPTFYGFTYQETGIPVVRIGNILNEGVLDSNLSNYVFVHPDIARRFPRTTIEEGDIVMAVRGDGSTGKRIGMVTTPLLFGANISPNLLRFKADKRNANPCYLYNFMTSAAGQSLIDNYITRTAKKTITAQNIKIIPILLPPFRLQEEFASRVEEINQQREQGERSLKQLETLFAALQHRAFTPGDAALALPAAEPFLPITKPTFAPKILRPTPPLQPCLTLDF